MSKFRVRMVWVEKDQEWQMIELPQEETIQEFYNCPTLRKRFEGLKKMRLNEYVITIVPVDRGSIGRRIADWFDLLMRRPID